MEETGGVTDVGTLKEKGGPLYFYEYNWGKSERGVSHRRRWSRLGYGKESNINQYSSDRPGHEGNTSQ